MNKAAIDSGNPLETQPEPSKELYTKLNWTQKTPYLNMGIMELQCEVLIFTGSTLPLIFLILANTLKKSEV